MRKYLDIPLTFAVTLTLTVAMLWPLEAPPPAPEGSDKLVHFIAFAALALPSLKNSGEKINASVFKRSLTASTKPTGIVDFTTMQAVGSLSIT